jgi:hypothetical protein
LFGGLLAKDRRDFKSPAFCPAEREAVFTGHLCDKMPEKKSAAPPEAKSDGKGGNELYGEDVGNAIRRL